MRSYSSFVGDWSNGMTRVSKTFSGSSILSSPVSEKDTWQGVFFCYSDVPINTFNETTLPKAFLLNALIYTFCCDNKSNLNQIPNRRVATVK